MKVTHLIFKYLFLFTLLLGIVGCEKDNLKEQESSKTTNKTIINKVDVDQIPELQGFVSQKLGKYPVKSNPSGSFVDTPFGYIPLENVTEVINTDGDTNYTFTLLPKKPKPFAIYNMVINPAKEGGKPVSFVLEYVMEKDFADDLFFKKKFMHQFEGQVNKYSLEEFVDTDMNKDAPPCPCGEANVSSGGFSGGFVGGGSSGDTNYEDPYNDIPYDYTDGYSGNTGDVVGTGTTSGTGGGGCRLVVMVECFDVDITRFGPNFCSVVGYLLDCTSTKSDCPVNTDGSCPDTSGAFGVNELELAQYLGIESPYRFTLYFDENQDLLDAMGSRLWVYRDNPAQLESAKDFVLTQFLRFAEGHITKEQAILILESEGTEIIIETIALLNTAVETGAITEDQRSQLKTFLGENGWSEEAVKEITLTIITETSQEPWVNSNGLIDGKAQFSYTGYRDLILNGQTVREFRLSNGDKMARGNYALCSGCSE